MNYIQGGQRGAEGAGGTQGGQSHCLHAIDDAPDSVCIDSARVVGCLRDAVRHVRVHEAETSSFRKSKTTKGAIVCATCAGKEVCNVSMYT